MEHRIRAQHSLGGWALCASAEVKLFGVSLCIHGYLVNPKAQGHQKRLDPDPAEAGWAPGGQGSPLP